MDQQSELCPDGLRVAVPWGDFQVGESVFFPCLNQDMARKQLAKIAKRTGFKLQPRVVVEHGILGLRVWRTA